ncbi:MAG: AAA family ATPase, partial [Limisphaerales bacterium]
MSADTTGTGFSQSQLLPFLLNPASYQHRPRTVRLIQTHASLVFLAPPFVFKVKKPVNFGFLDFSTLAKRRHFCEREVALNRRLCPRVYLGVVPITRRDGRFAFGGDGEVGEYAVQMRRLAEHGFLLHRLRRGRLGRAVLDRLVEVLQVFYEAQHPTAEVEAWGRVARLKISTDENFRQTRGCVGQTISPAAFNAIRAFTNGFFQTHRELFVRRIRERRIRDCHGDLHLDHIHAGPKALHVYDCIEFNDRFRYVDVANDMAFLAMDLDFHRRPDLAAHFVERIARALKDRELPRLLDFYKCYRAYVRGKVESLHSRAAAVPGAERQEAAEHARRYFRLALRYAVAGSRPLVLLVMGRIASGKSTLAEALAKELGWPVASSDRVRKELAGFPIQARGDATARARLYSPAMTRRTYAALLATAERHVAAGESCVLDATFGSAELRRVAIRRLRRRGIRFLFVE